MINKFILTKWSFSLFFVLGVFSVVSLLAGLFAFVTQPFTEMAFDNVVIGLIAGAVYYLAVYIFFTVLRTEETSRVIPLFNLSPVFVALFAGIFLGEILTPINYAGITLIVAGAVLISTLKIQKHRSSKALGHMVIAVLMFATVDVTTKYLLGRTDYWAVFTYLRIGTFLAGIPLLIFGWNDIVKHAEKYGIKLIALVSLNNILNFMGVLFITIAASSNFIGLTIALSSTQPLFVLGITVVLSIFYPHILKEEIGRANLTRKVISILLMLIGVVLIT